ncbi:MAG: DUF6356 family protein [Actinomycetota bacterium]
MGMTSRFTEHPAQVGETYFEHQRVAFGFSRTLFAAAFQAAVHAVCPWLCCTSASDKIRELNDRIVAGGRGRAAAEAAAREAVDGMEPAASVAAG